MKRDLSKFDPYNVPQIITVTTQQISKMEECSLARKIFFAAVEYQPKAPQHQQAALDQLIRNSSSIGLNFQEAWGKAKGYFGQGVIVARGSAFECYENLQYIPELQYLIPDVELLCDLLTQWYEACEKKNAENAQKKHWKNY